MSPDEDANPIGLPPRIQPGMADVAPLSAATGVEPPAIPITERQRKTLQASMLVSYIFLFATYAGVITILLPQQITDLDAASKVNNLALVTASSSVVTLFVQPLVGALSDRTRSRFGKRSPWILFGGIAGGSATIALQISTTIFWVTIFWVSAQALLNAFQAPMAAIVADRIRSNKRATISAFKGAGMSIGGAAGIIFAGLMVHRLGVAYSTFGVSMIIVSILFVLINRDESTADMPKEPFQIWKFLKGFWVSPRKHPDYAWAFAGRFVMILGYQAIIAYQFYIFTDYIGLSSQEAGTTAGMVSAVSMVMLVVSTMVFGRLSDALERRKVFVFVASVVMAVGAIVPLFIPSILGMFIFGSISGLGYGAYVAVDVALMVDVLPSQGDAGRDLGILNVATNIPQAITPMIAAFILTLSHGSYSAIFIYAAAAVVISSFLVLPIRSVR